MNDNLKQCSKCKETKNLTEFSKDKAQKDGLRPSCRICESERKRLYREANLDKIKEKQRQWVEKNREYLREKSRLYHQANRERSLERSRSYYQQHQAEQIEYHRIYRQANPEIIKEGHRQWAKNNPEKKREIAERWRKNNPEKARLSVRLAGQRYRERYPGRVKEIYHRYRRANPEKTQEIQSRHRAKKAGVNGDYSAEEWKKLLAYYGNVCLCCGVTAKDTRFGKLTPDHIVPLSQGGSNDISNIQPLCARCNSGKGAAIIDYRLSVPNFEDWKGGEG